jgi:WD40 repeat protein
MKISKLVAATLCLACAATWCLTAPVPEEHPKEQVTLKGFKGPARALVFSPDGKTLASAHDLGGTLLWDVATGKLKATFKGHLLDDSKGFHGRVFGVAFSPDGKTLATCADDRTVRLWNIENGKEIAVLNNQMSDSMLAFSPDGKSLAEVSGPKVMIWDLQTKQIQHRFYRKTPAPPPIAYSPKGTLFAVTFGYDTSDFSIWDVKADKLISTCNEKERNVMCVGFNPDRTIVASADAGKTIRLWDVATGKNTATFAKQSEFSHALVFSPDGQILACAGRPNLDTASPPSAVRILRVSSGKVLASLNGHPAAIGHLAFSPDGRMLASGSGEMIKLWKLPSRWKTDD